MNPIAKYKWEKRVLIVNAKSDLTVGYKRQEQLLNKGKTGMKDRDLVIFRMYADHWIDPNGNPLNEDEALSLINEYKLPQDSFRVLLIGKDGTVKMNVDDLVSTREIFRLIDQMPMRKREIQERKGNR